MATWLPWHRTPPGRVARERELEQHVRELRGAFVKLAAAVMWRGGVPPVAFLEPVVWTSLVVVAPVTEDTGKGETDTEGICEQNAAMPQRWKILSRW